MGKVTSEADKKAAIIVRVPVDVRTQAKIQAVKENRSLQEVVSTLLNDWLSKKGERKTDN